MSDTFDNDPTTEQRGLSRRQLLAMGATAGAGLGLLPSLDLLSETASAAPLRAGAKVIFVVHDNNPFFVPMRLGFERFGRMEGWRTQWVGPPKQDIATTVNLQASAISAGAAGVIFTRIDSSSFDANIRRAQSKGIKVILTNVASAGYKKLGVGFVGQDFIPAGTISGLQAAKHAHKLTGRKSGLIITANFAPGNSALDERIIGIKRGIAAYNRANGTSYNTEVLVTSSDQSEAVGRIDAAYTRHGKAIVGWAHAAFDAQFTAVWAASKGLTHTFAIGGFDLIPPVLRLIRSGQINWTIGQNPWDQGFIASALLATQFDPGYPAFTYDTGAEVVDASNITKVIKRESRFEKI